MASAMAVVVMEEEAAGGAAVEVKPEVREAVKVEDSVGRSYIEAAGMGAMRGGEERVVRLQSTYHDRLALVQETVVGLFPHGSSSLAECNCRRTRCLHTAMYHSAEVGMPARSHYTSSCTHCCTPAYLSQPPAAGGRGRTRRAERGELRASQLSMRASRLLRETVAKKSIDTCIKGP